MTFRIFRSRHPTHLHHGLWEMDAIGQALNGRHWSGIKIH